MGVFTEITEQELIAFLNKYTIGTLTSFEGIEAGSDNTNYIVKTSEGKFVLTIFEERVHPSEVPYFMEIKEFLSKQGILCPTPFYGRNKKLVQELKEKPATIVSFLEGDTLTGKKPTLDQCRVMGKVLGTVHAAASDFESCFMPRSFLLHAKNDYMPAIQNADSLQPGLKERFETEVNYITKNYPTDIPWGPVHADASPDNVLFKGDKFSGIIDFYFSHHNAFIYDLMTTVSFWAFNDEGWLILERSDAIIEAYDKARPLSSKERRLLPFFGRAAMLRYALYRLLKASHAKTEEIRTGHLQSMEKWLAQLQVHKDIEENIYNYGLLAAPGDAQPKRTQ
ncbi:MAG: homoserine kinase [Alphaproteobacteria bacterium]